MRHCCVIRFIVVGNFFMLDGYICYEQKRIIPKKLNPFSQDKY